jgi:hypothetical protein
MSSAAISIITFACIFGGSLSGLFLRAFLPQHHLSDKTMDAVKVGIGLIGTLAALVLGLLISSAINSFDTINTELKQCGVKIILLDRTLARYGPEAKEIRALLRRTVATGIQRLWPEGKVSLSELTALESNPPMEKVLDELRSLAPQNNTQRELLSQALQIGRELMQSRWLLLEHTQSFLPTPLIPILVFWLIIFFFCFGLISESNSTVIVIMLVCTLSVCGAIFLILEMNHPFYGIIKVSSVPLQKALELLSK